MPSVLRITFYILMAFSITINVANATARIKDIVDFEGIRPNILVGSGLIAGLNGTGDNLKNSIFTEKELIAFLDRLGVNSRGVTLKTKNIALVMVTATLPPFSRAGSKIDIQISTIGDAKSIKGGTLLATPLLGADGEVYAVAQGQVSIGALSDPEDRTAKAHPSYGYNPTAGYINGGAIIEREIPFQLNKLNEFKLALKNADVSTARSIAVTINGSIGQQIATAIDPGTVSLRVPSQYQNNPLELLADIERLRVYPDTPAKIIIDEATGTIVFGENVRISNVAVAQGNLVVKISDELQFASQLGLIEQQAQSEPGKEIAILPEGATLSDLVQGLNSLGVTPRDLVSILKTIKKSGALQAEIEVR
jgi:flagellar P-ring protein precursor FlgI